MSLHLATTPAANALLADDPLALLVGMLLDQQCPEDLAVDDGLVISPRDDALDAWFSPTYMSRVAARGAVSR